MTTKELETAILDIIYNTYDAVYNKKLEVIKNNNSYELILDLDNYEKPIRWVFEGDECQFLNFVKKQLYDSQLYRTRYYSGYKFIKSQDE